MMTIFHEPSRNALINRIQSLDHTATAQWGKMNLYQMLRHVTIWNEWIQGKSDKVYKQELLGRIFGKMALRNMIKDEKPIKKNLPTGKGFTVQERTGDIATLKIIWSKLLADYAHYSNPYFIHDFFGKMSEAEIGVLVYKHMDHHLRQFGR
ncbi:DUF1569 domain-containing protein [Chitinophaga nivalis]|uniref:DUF1569 domain-containing protein n=1 Tax=Chitinophaga nivalis TaxID=2991709 RepID=A0ABT3IIZ4_9BACT|nr:DUF1569 domain-containing protein [Chitinophaga nivalis]MCW3466372.1 DUF1569 domain-containing protein [Chitinophaga nivalis]MCW3483937.1 DUF1569 domain-containing protein [Chitinophaga nivalis]